MAFTLQSRPHFFASLSVLLLLIFFLSFVYFYDDDDYDVAQGGSTFNERIFYFSSNLCPSRAHCFDTTVLHAYDSSMIKHALYFVINVQIDEKDRACHLCVCF